MRRVCLWAFAILLGLAARAGVLSRAPDPTDALFLAFLIIGLLVATIVTVSVVTTIDYLFPGLRSGKRQRSNAVSAERRTAAR